MTKMKKPAGTYEKRIKCAHCGRRIIPQEVMGGHQWVSWRDLSRECSGVALGHLPSLS